MTIFSYVTDPMQIFKPKIKRKLNTDGKIYGRIT